MKITYTADAQMLLRDFLQRQNISKKSLSAIKQNGALLVNEVPVTVRYMLAQGEQVTVCLPAEQPSRSLRPSAGRLTIIYEDNYLCVVSKPAGISTMPSQLHPHDSLLERTLHHFIENKETGIPHIVTRLDRNTSGIVVFAKHQLIHHLMTDSITKTYLCAACGKIPAAGMIDCPIGRKSDSIIERHITADGKQALTTFIALHRSNDYSVALVKLHTGRTHQIRVHFQAIGHPLAGDTLYGHDTRLARQALHAFQIEFVHPFTEVSIILQDAPPEDLRSLIPML
ncbi:RluA family pseudouridine synthase [Macrococcus equipercicus]|uniref:Pseudouridine synthase n=1 Tax=Macrococcus equipercicus TaxID=69967 RepID=A0ABQ6RBM1_9STAP|nr:RluA family pseudouridine synthase [Macrococcus equipercicus]KAA1042599.1 RluA family pseudouridine synthase [Macrococcus equipercicus]